MPAISRAAGTARTVTSNALEVAFPTLRNTLQRVALTDPPTPLESADTLAATLCLDALQIKRDDQSGPIYGGNKVRKLEYLFGDAMHQSCDSIVTFGAIGSNHALATAIYATGLGLNCHVVMTEQAVTPYIVQTLRYHALLGTHLELADGYDGSVDIADRLASHHPGGADKLYRIPWGGSSSLGSLGFVNAGFELASQCGDAVPDVIYVACGTMGTVAGLALGLRLAGLETRIEAIGVTPRSLTTSDRIENLTVTANRELHAIDKTIPVFDDPMINVVLRDEFFGPGYAKATPECTEAVELIQKTEGITLETTYTGKALAALIHDARSQRLAGRRVVFWNTYNSRPYPSAVNDTPGLSLPDWAQHYL